MRGEALKGLSRFKGLRLDGHMGRKRMIPN